MGSRRKNGLPLLVVLPLAVAGTATTAAAQLPAPCSVDLAVSDHAVEAKVSSTQPGAASTFATYTVNLPPVPTRAVVTLQGSVSTGWPVSISPSSITTSGASVQSGRVDLTVVVPSGELPITGSVTLTARMFAGGIECTPDTVNEPTVTVLPYVEEVHLVAPETLFEFVEPGNSRTATVELAAKSNDDLTVQVRYEAPGEVAVTVPAVVPAHRNDNGTAFATLEVRLAVSAVPGDYPVTVKATTTAGEDDTSEGQITLIIRVIEQALPGPGILEALLAVALAGAAGAARAGRARRRKASRS